MYELEQSFYLYFLILIPLLGLLVFYTLNWKKAKQKEFADIRLLAILSPQKSNFKPILKAILFLLAITLLILGLTNPKTGIRLEKSQAKGIDIVFAIDVSKSMLAQDVAPNRLEKSKQIVSQIISNLTTDRIGIIAYAGNAFPVLPITTDYNAAKMFLQSMNTEMVSSQGSNLNAAINLCEKYFENNGNASRVMLLISDGEDHSQGAQEAASIAQKKGIKIITIGVGTTTGGPIPVKNNGVVESFHRDKSTGQIVITKLRPEALQTIAKAANGDYISANNTQQVTSFVQNSLKNTKKNKFQTTEIANFDSQFQWFIGIAFFVLFIDLFLLEQKTRWIQRLNLFSEHNNNN